MGVTGMGTTFIQTVDISELDIENGGRTNYTIKVDKQDAQDRIYLHVTGRNGNTNVFSGTDILSESGVTSGFQEYAGGFDFAGSVTTLVIEIGGRDINLAIGPLFDDITINVLYNVVETIVNETITSVEMWVAIGGSTETEVIDIVENIFENNDIVVDEPGDNLYFEPEFDAPDLNVSYETVEMELEMPSMEMEEIEVVAIETEMEMEMELEMPEPETQPEVEEVKDEPIEEVNEEPKEDVANEPENKESTPEADANEDKPEDMEEPEDKGEADKSEDNEKPVKKQEQKEKAAKKIVKKMGDKGRYDTTNQTKTLIVMQVLGDTKTFFDTQQQLQDRVDFFTDFMIPDTKIEDNNMAGYFLFVGSDGLMNQIEESQWQN
jgi:hypothetical protein